MKDWKKFLFGFFATTVMIANVSAETIDVTDETTLRECFAKESATCRLNKDTITLENQLVLAQGKTITLNLNGKTLNLADYSNYAITVKGNLTIEGNGTVNIPGLYGIGTSVNLGNLTIKGGTYNQDVTDYVKDGYASRKIGDNYVVDKLYKINSTTATNGTFSVDKETAIPGETVTIVITPASTYALKSLKVSGNSEIEVKDNKFVMPESDVEIIAEFQKIINVEFPSIDEDPEIETPIATVKNKETAENVIKKTLENDETLSDKIKDIVPKVFIYIGDVDVERFENLEPELKKSIDSKAGNSTISNYYMITLDLFNAENDEFITNIEKLSDKINFTILLSEDLVNSDKSIDRVFTIIREHNGTVETLPATLSDDGKYITFETDSFSVYALAYEDKKIIDTNTPQTYDEVVTYIIIGGIAVLGIVGLGLYIKKRN